MRHFFESGQTRGYSFRRQQLQLLKQAVSRYEKEIAAALYQDLRKSPEEAYATETGLVLAEIGVTLKNLEKWMRPQRVRTNLMNFPSSGRIYRDPLGIVLIIAPWNYPLQLLLVPLAAALAGGNGAVVKPSEFAPATAAILAKIIREIYPPHYVQVLQGSGAEVVPAVMNSFRFDHIFYTGSIPVGRTIYQQAAKELIPVTLELGGKSPAVVESDADLVSSARRIAMGKFANAGQTCVAPDYLLVHEAVYPAFLKQLKSVLFHFYGDRPQESGSYGRIINTQRFDKLAGYLPLGTIIAGGQTDRQDLFIAPTLLEDVSPDSAMMKEEIFGPLLPIYPYKTMEEGLQLIRRNPDPLAFYVFTADGARERAWIDALAFGGGCVNNTVWQFANHHFPFGGVGHSGIGAYHGKYSFETFTHAKPVLKTPVWFDPGIKYPPLQGKLKWIRRIIR